MDPAITYQVFHIRWNYIYQTLIYMFFLCVQMLNALTNTHTHTCHCYTDMIFLQYCDRIWCGKPLAENFNIEWNSYEWAFVYLLWSSLFVIFSWCWTDQTCERLYWVCWQLCQVIIIHYSTSWVELCLTLDQQCFLHCCVKSCTIWDGYHNITAMLWLERVAKPVGKSDCQPGGNCSAYLNEILAIWLCRQGLWASNIWFQLDW